jgi:hypothetical protein
LLGKFNFFEVVIQEITDLEPGYLY